MTKSAQMGLFARLSRWSTLVAVILLAVVAMPVHGATEDVLLLEDGRELHGQIVSENRNTIVFSFMNPDIGISVTMTFPLHMITELRRDVEIAVEEVDTPKDETTARGPDAAGTDDDSSRFSMRRDGGNGITSIYVVPMRGQVGTDVTPSIYEEIAEDIRIESPDVIVFAINCRDYNVDRIATILGDVDPSEFGKADSEGMREIVEMFHLGFPDTRQVVWIEQSNGMSTALALAWNELYMQPEAELRGLEMFLQQTGANRWPDANVRGKMMAAWINGLKGIFEFGDHPPALAEAMIDPEKFLSGSWNGRKVQWRSDLFGEEVVDASDERVAGFRSKEAEDLCISDGTAETLDDLALLLGFREYSVIDEHPDKIFEGYRTDWRGTFDRALKLWKDYQQYLQWGELNKAKRSLEGVLQAIKKYPAVATRIRDELGLTELYVEIMLERLEEQMKQGGGGRGGGGGRSGAGGGGGR
jgi:hypothetical protein